MKMCKCDCGKPVEAERYSMCKECWWKQDPRNVGGKMRPDMTEERPESLNNRFIVETYKEDRALKATVQNGFAMVSQKVSLKGLKLLADISYVNGQETTQYLAGSKVYIREEYLQSQAWAKKSFTSEAISGEFMIVDATYIEFVVPA